MAGVLHYLLTVPSSRTDNDGTLSWLTVIVTFVGAFLYSVRIVAAGRIRLVRADQTAEEPNPTTA